MKRKKGQKLQIALTIHQISFHICRYSSPVIPKMPDDYRMNRGKVPHMCKTNSVWKRVGRPGKVQYALMCNHDINISTNCLLLTGQPSHYLGCLGWITTAQHVNLRAESRHQLPTTEFSLKEINLEKHRYMMQNI